MNSIMNARIFKIRIIWIILAVVVIAAAGGGYYYWTQQQTRTTAGSGAARVATTVARRGNISLLASGTGTLVAAQQVNLSFPTSGTVATVNVKAGQLVKTGDVLATLSDSDIETLTAAVNTANVNLANAQQTLDKFNQGAASALGNAQINLINAQKAASDAKTALVTGNMQRCDDATTLAYYNAYIKAKKNLDVLGVPSDTNSSEYLYTYLPALKNEQAAYSTYMYCNRYTAYEVNSSQANATLTAASVQQDQSIVATLTPNKGLDPYTLLVDQNTVASAKIALAKAQKNLDGTVIKAPFDGSIVSVAGNAGDAVGSGTFIIMADLYHPFVQFDVDEVDMGKVALNENVNVVFDALPKSTFTGKVVVIQPQLVTSGNSQALQGLAQIDTPMNYSILPAGANAAVDVVGGSATNVVLIPLGALRDLGDGTYGVFVRDNNSTKLTFRTVTIGLQDLTNVEITSGLQAGEVVSTGL